MAQFKRFNASENDNYNSSDAYPEGTLTWDPDNGLRIHDGNTSGGEQVGSGDVYWGDIQNKPNGNTAVHDLIGGASSLDNGKYLKQTTTGVSEWAPIPTTYDTLTIDTKIIGGIDGRAGTQITGIEASLGYGVPYRYAFVSGNDAFGNLFNRGSAIIGWKMYPANDPSAFVTITEFLNNDLGAPSLGFDGSLAEGPWIAESSDYSAGANGPLTLSADTKNWVLGVNGVLTLPVGGDIQDSTGTSVLGGNANTGNVLFYGDTLTVNNGVTNTGFLNLENDGGNLVIGTNTDAAVRISVNGNNTEKAWVFGTDGSITFPDLSIQTTAYTGGGSGTALPLDAAGVLKNDGTGTLSWSSLDIQDLTDNGNVLNFTQQQANWEENNAASPAYIQNRPTIITSYYQLEDKPTLFNGDYLSLTGTPSLSAVATTGMYGDLTGTPTSLADFTNDPGFITAGDLAVSTGGAGSLTYSNGLFTYEGPNLALVATSGSYNDLSNTPTIPSLGSITFTDDQIGSNTNTVQIIASTYAKLSSSNSHIWAEPDTAKIQAGNYIWTVEDWGFFTAPTGGKFRAASGTGTEGGYVFNVGGGNTGMFCETDGVLDFYTSGQKIVSLSTGTIVATKDISAPGIIFPTTEALAWDSSIKQEPREAGLRFGVVVDGEKDVTIKTDQGGKPWLFDEFGVLHLPASVGDIKRDGVSVLDGSYTPADATNWAVPAPTTISEALDRLAAELKRRDSGNPA